MDARPLLVTGTGGFIGAVLASSLRRRGLSVAGLAGRSSSPATLHVHDVSGDLLDHSFLSRWVAEVSPDVIIHGAALSSSDLCETNPTDAWRVNFEGTKHLARCAREGCVFIFLSTDLVFDGAIAPPGGFVESDAPTPKSVYAQTKHAAEEFLLREIPRSIVLRLSLTYGHASTPRKGFLGWMARGLQDGSSFPLFRDEWRTPLYLPDLAEFLLAILPSAGMDGGSAESRLFHLAGPDRITRYDFGREYTRSMGFPENLIEPVLQKSVPSAAPRSPDVSLNGSKATRVMGHPFTGIRDGIAELALLGKCEPK